MNADALLAYSLPVGAVDALLGFQHPLTEPRATGSTNPITASAFLYSGSTDVTQSLPTNSQYAELSDGDRCLVANISSSATLTIRYPTHRIVEVATYSAGECAEFVYADGGWFPVQ